jgi:CDP-diacylglycerol--glycerol-3-phosphate 3-phosphatidyltransferase
VQKLLGGKPAAEPPAAGAPAAHAPGTGRPSARCPRGCANHGLDRLLTVASGVTAVRTVLCVALGMAGIARSSGLLLAAALGVHWLGDVADGLVARRRDEETLTGAVLDICADRLCVSVVYLGFVVGHPEFALALAVYLIEFMFVDAVLSLAFLRWPIAGPNYFARVDRLIWRLNWWPPAKLVNSAVPALLCVWLGSPAMALAVAAGLLALKSACLVRVVRLGAAAGERCEGHSS